MHASITMWKFSQFGNHFCCVWSLSTFYCKVCEFVQTLIERKLAQSYKKLASYIHVQINLTPTSYKPMYTLNPNLIQTLCSREKINLLSPILNSIVMQHIFTHLPLMPSMFWYLHWMNKAWFMFVRKNFPWNALEVVKINHKSYLQQLANSGISRQSLQMYFEFELQSLRMCLDSIDLVYPTYYDSKCDSSYVTF
jgi:hypothetical protein